MFVRGRGSLRTNIHDHGYRMFIRGTVGQRMNILLVRELRSTPYEHVTENPPQDGPRTNNFLGVATGTQAGRGGEGGATITGGKRRPYEHLNVRTGSLGSYGVKVTWLFSHRPRANIYF